MAKAQTVNKLKFKMLCHRLAMPRPWVLGHLELLWQSTHERVSPWFETEEEIEVAAEWCGDPGVFAAALVEFEFVDHAEADGIPDAYRVHDWEEHVPDWVRKRLQRADDDPAPAPAERTPSDARRTTADNGGQKPAPPNTNTNTNTKDKETHTARIMYPYDWMSETWNHLVPVDTKPDDFKHDKVRRWWKARTEPKPEFVDLCNEIARSSWLTKDFAHELPLWCFGPRNWEKIMSGKYRDKGKPDARVGAEPADDPDWRFQTVRHVDYNRHGTHPRWEEYIDHAYGFPPKTAPTFDDWLEAQHE